MYLLWLDLETTGRDPARRRILELYACVTKEDLKPLGSLHVVLHRPPKTRFTPAALAIHLANGLYDESARSTTSIETATRLLRELIEVHCDEKPWLAGSGVNFDQRWIEHWMPSIAPRLNYRIFDLRPVQQALEIWAGIAIPEPKSNHRAAGDVVAALKRAEEIRQILGKLASPGKPLTPWNGFT